LLGGLFSDIGSIGKAFQGDKNYFYFFFKDFEMLSEMPYSDGNI